ncbi:MAG TPA: glycosyltransferase [Phycisphaerae bacterium]|nr:glycosyltransferase [Phycisphaerae bacterium]
MAAGTDRPAVALAHHWLMSMRGGEKTLAAMAELFPDAPIHALLARPERLCDTLRRRELRLSWLQRFNRIPDLQRKALPFLAAAARSLDATAFDAVICSDAAIIKAIRTRPDALKLCYCHSPMRYVWDLYDDYCRAAGPGGRLGLRLFAGRLREADRRAAYSVTAFVANSRAVADRIRRCYGRASVVIPPPVDVDSEPTPANKCGTGVPSEQTQARYLGHTNQDRLLPDAGAPTEDFYLVVGECVGYKRHDLAVDACTRLGRPLVVIGTGPMLKDLRKRAGQCVRLPGWQSDDVVRDYMRRCRALLFCGEEDFGLVPVEAQAAGRPVIAYRAGGATETVVDGSTGLFFDRQLIESVIDAIRRFESGTTLWPSGRIREHARQFSRETFRRRFKSFFEWCQVRWREGGPAAVREAMESLDAESRIWK